MEEKLVDGDATPNLESLQKVRLTALLHDLMKEGKLEAAQLLGVNYKTLAAAVDSGVLTPRLSDALEKVLLSREIEAFEKVRERVEELEGRLEAAEQQTRSIPGEVEEAVGERWNAAWRRRRSHLSTRRCKPRKLQPRMGRSTREMRRLASCSGGRAHR